MRWRIEQTFKPTAMMETQIKNEAHVFSSIHFLPISVYFLSGVGAAGSEYRPGHSGDPAPPLDLFGRIFFRSMAGHKPAAEESAEIGIVDFSDTGVVLYVWS